MAMDNALIFIIQIFKLVSLEYSNTITPYPDPILSVEVLLRYRVTMIRSLQNLQHKIKYDFQNSIQLVSQSADH